MTAVAVCGSAHFRDESKIRVAVSAAATDPRIVTGGPKAMTSPFGCALAHVADVEGWAVVDVGDIHVADWLASAPASLRPTVAVVFRCRELPGRKTRPGLMRAVLRELDAANIPTVEVWD